MENLQLLNPNRSKRALQALKFIIGVVLLPEIYAVTVAFINESQAIERAFLSFFSAGVISFLAFYLFIYEPGKIYQKGQKITETIFRFIAPLVKVAPFVIPIYSIGLFLIYYLLSLFIKSNSLLQFFIFFIGFSITFHLVFTARSIRSRKGDFLMANYIFSFGLIYIINISLLTSGFTVLFSSFSWVSFCKNSFQISKGIFVSLFSQLFL